MDELTTPDGRPLGESRCEPASPAPPASPGVRGWLLVLCLMLTVIGPAITFWMLAEQYASFAPYFAGDVGVRLAIFAATAVTVCSVVYSVGAGLRLWLMRPRAVTSARRALFLGLAADAITTLLEVSVGPAAIGEGLLFNEVIVRLVPSLIFFTAAVAYLNKSARVRALAQGAAASP